MDKYGIFKLKIINKLIYFYVFRDKILVHVVVDPALSKILRPHQREVSMF